MESYSQEQINLYNKLAECTLRMKNGDEVAFNEIYNLMFPHINALIVSRKVDVVDADDIAQEIMISVYKNITTINDPQSTYKWIMRLSSNKIVDYFRQNASKLENETHIIAEEDDLGEAEQLYNKTHSTEGISLKIPEDIFVNKERQQKLFEIVGSLKDEQRQIIILHCINDLTFKEIAETLGVSENTVKTKFYRSLNKLEASIYDVEKREGIRLHSVGIVPFILLMFMLNAQRTEVSAKMMADVSNRLSKQINELHNASIPTTNITKTKTTGIKAWVAGHKAASVAVAIVAAGAVAGGIFAVSQMNSDKPKVVYEEKIPEPIVDTEPHVVESETTETESEEKTDDEVFNEYLSNISVISGEVGQVNCIDGDNGLEYTTDSIINGTIGKCIDDLDNDGYQELLMVDYSGDTGISLNIFENFNGTCTKVGVTSFSDEGILYNQKNSDVFIYEKEGTKYILFQYYDAYSYIADGYYRGFALCHYDGTSIVTDCSGSFAGSSMDDDEYLAAVDNMCSLLGIDVSDDYELYDNANFSKYLSNIKHVVSVNIKPTISYDAFNPYMQKIESGELSGFKIAIITVE